ncbi:MAG: hypothetical protein AB1578_15295 [Thermodesulfobacteriota bacterium]
MKRRGTWRRAGAAFSLSVALAWGWAANCGAEEVLELRLPRSLLAELAAPAGHRRPIARDDFLALNPRATSLDLDGDPVRFAAWLAIPEVGAFRLQGDRNLARRLAAGDAAAPQRWISPPEGWEIGATFWEEDALLVVVLPASPAPSRAPGPPPIVPFLPSVPAAGDPVREEPGAPTLLQALSERGSATLRLLGSHRYQRPALGGLNPENRVLDLPRQVSEGEARLDLSLDLGPLYLTAKPRARLTREHRQDGPRAGDSDTDAEVLLLEGRAQARIWERGFVSFGRENLQWGPAQFVNPSNPFFADNGRDNPVREVPGMDFLRVLWLPTPSLTLSWIANTGRGEGELGGRSWHPSHALKLDYLGYEVSGGVLAHGGGGADGSLRGYGQWTASDAMLLYGEASVSRRDRDDVSQEGTDPIDRQVDGDFALYSVLGAGYTLELGPTVSLEYAYNESGYDNAEAERFFDRAHAAAALVRAGLLELGPGDVAVPQQLLRRHYLFAQYLHTEIAGRLTVILRWAQNLEDRSGLGSTYLEWSLADRWRLFGFGAYGSGGNRDEFGSALRYLGSVGAEFTAF